MTTQEELHPEEVEGMTRGGIDSEQELSAGDLAAVREVVLRAYPETVPEMVQGESVTDLLRSIEPAAAAYRRIVDGIEARAPVMPVVPAGGAPPATVDPERLPSVEKIRRGLATRR